MKLAILGAGRVGLTLKNLLEEYFEVVIGGLNPGSPEVRKVDTSDPVSHRRRASFHEPHPGLDGLPLHKFRFF